MIWNNCELIYKDNKLKEDLPSNVYYSFLRYRNTLHGRLEHNVWYDPDSKICFGLDSTWLNFNSRESFFVSDKKNFLNGNRWDKNYVLDYYAASLGGGIVESDEIIYKDMSTLKELKDSKILIVGGGPSANLCDWNSDDYDSVWSCNHFFLNDKLSNLDLGLAVLGTEVDLGADNEELHDYLQNSTSLICFEDRMATEERKHFSFMKKTYEDRCMYMHTRYRGKIGTIPRLLCLATSIGAKEVHFVGMDGVKPSAQVGDFASHSFQKNKNNTGTINYDLYRRHYVALWDYLLNYIGKDVKFQNLGEAYEHNMTRDISKQMFPLEM